MPEWVFAKQDPAGVKRDPQETELFKSENSGEGEYAGTDALVREILQNSLDAGETDGQPVRVRFALYESDAGPDAATLAHYVRRLQAPLQYRDVEFDSAGLPLLSKRFLVVEDFGTRGLCGDPMRNADPPLGPVEPEDFFWFWRNIGRSGKTGDDLGRWGLGKAVYRAASRIGCMLGLTVRRNDQQTFLMGQAVLRMHTLDGVEYVSDGFWCDHKDSQGVPVPISDPDQLQQFRDDWNLTRGQEPGLSVVVPWVAEELTGERLLQAVCIHFFLPILQGRLVVDLVASDVSQEQARIDAESIHHWIEKIPWTGPKRAKRNVAPPLRFIRRCLQDQSPVVETLLLGEKKLPEMTAHSFAPDVLKSARRRIEDGDLVHVALNISLLPKHADPVTGVMDLYLQKDPPEGAVDTYFVREGMTITKLNSRAALRRVQVFVHVDRGPLARFLGDTEGPAHESWDSSAERPHRFWKTWKGRVQFCSKVVNPLLEVLMPPNQKADFDLLSDLFSVKQLKLPQRGQEEKKKAKDDSEFPTLPKSIRWYRLDPRRGGFRVVANAQQPIPPGARLKVSLAYDVPRGDALKKWTELDFDVRKTNGSVELTGEGMKIQRPQGNVLLLKELQSDFWLRVEGFDENLDLFVRIDEEIPFEETADEGEASPEAVAVLDAAPATAVAEPQQQVSETREGGLRSVFRGVFRGVLGGGAPTEDDQS